MKSDNRDAPDRPPTIHPYEGPAGGWGSLSGMLKVAFREAPPLGNTAHQLLRQNKHHGFMCASCAWAKPAKEHPAEFCENGAKATFWDLTKRRCTPELFQRYTVTELLEWSDFALEQAGRLTDPLRYDAATDRYVPCAWEEVFATIGKELRALDPRSVVFYASGRASLETSYMYGLLARMYGSQNLPDSSNMCHESTSVGLRESLGTSVGTVTLEDFSLTDAIFFFGQNVGSNSPRMLHELQKVSQRGKPIVTFNPLRERGLERFRNPQSPLQMLAGTHTRISSQYHQVKTGGDLAALTGICKWVIEQDDQARQRGALPLLDHAFITEHTLGFAAFARFCRETSWSDIEHHSGLPRADLEAAAMVYANAKAVMGIYGMGLTQHRFGVDNVHMLSNLLLLRGNVGRPGAGACPVRGHSNVQGQRTVGITEKPELAPLDILEKQYGFSPPRDKGLNTIETCEGVLSGEVKAFIGLGGNFVRAIPDGPRVEPAWRKLRLTVQIATKLNRSHLINGAVAFLLPCLSRIELDQQATGPQTVTTEDSTSVIHASFGDKAPASAALLSEPAIIVGIAKATLPENPHVDWDAWLADYSRVREAIAQTYPTQFANFNQRLQEPGGFYRGNKGRNRDWTDAPGGRANFYVPPSLSATGFADDILRLMTLRSNDQFNTTVYGYDDRFRGISGTRNVVLMNASDMRQLNINDGEIVGLQTVYDDGIAREKPGLRVVTYDIPKGCIGAYYPECNVLIPVSHNAEGSHTPAAKSVPVRVVRTAGG